MNSSTSSLIHFLRRWRPSSTTAILSCTACVTSVGVFQNNKNGTQNNNIPIMTAKCEAASLPGDDDNDNTIKDKSTERGETNRSRLVFLGTGSSTGCPKPVCTMVSGLLDKQQHDNKQNKNLQQYYSCRVSDLAIMGDPKHNKNYRNNPSLLISHCEEEGGDECRNIVIDVGKTFREGALRWFPLRNIKSLDAIILTHHHMDAVGGLDDVRGFQQFVTLPNKDASVVTTNPKKRKPIPVYLSQSCLSDVSDRFPWLFPNHQKRKAQEKPYTSGDIPNAPIVKRDVAALDVQIFDSYKPFTVYGLDITPLPVLHGDDLISYAFAFSIKNNNKSSNSNNRQATNIVYISDISKIIPETLRYIQENLAQPTDILIVDSLLVDREHPVHFSLQQAIELAKKIQPTKMTYIVGMNCDNFLPHDEMNQKLLQEHKGTKIQLAHDGLVLYL